MQSKIKINLYCKINHSKVKIAKNKKMITNKQTKKGNDKQNEKKIFKKTIAQ